MQSALGLLCLAVVAAQIAPDLDPTIWCKSERGGTVRCDNHEEPVNLLDDLGTYYGTDKATSDNGYTVLYDPIFAHRRQERLNFLEIGCFRGASALMWADYFPNANITCIDAHPESLEVRNVNPRINAIIANQGSEDDLRRVEAETGPLDIIIDDGSHLSDHMQLSFKTLFPGLKLGGVYIIEDLSTQNNRQYKGSGCNKPNALKFVLGLMNFVMMRSNCHYPTHPWEEYIKDIQLFGGSGMAVVHKGVWTNLEGSGNSEVWRPGKPVPHVNEEDDNDYLVGGHDGQFMAWGAINRD